MKHPTKDHSLFGIDLIDELVEECLQLDGSSDYISDFVEDTDPFDYLGSLKDEADYDEVWEVHNLFDYEDDNTDIGDLSQEAELLKLLDKVYENLECSKKVEVHVAETKKPFIAQPDSKESNDNSSSLPPPMKLKLLPSHLKYAYLDAEQQLPVIIASNIHQE
ncbi:hypothetical protein CR513_52154, partial [Mucuna pruriens]